MMVSPGTSACRSAEPQEPSQGIPSAFGLVTAARGMTGTGRRSSDGGAEMHGVSRFHHAGLWLYTMLVLGFTFLLLSQLV
jgi:hypothetical protein